MLITYTDAHGNTWFDGFAAFPDVKNEKHRVDTYILDDHRDHVDPVSPGGNPEKSTWSWIA